MYHTVVCFYHLNHTRMHLLQITKPTVNIFFFLGIHSLMKLIHLQESLMLLIDKGFTNQFKATF